jgi:hypothetical protein
MKKVIIIISSVIGLIFLFFDIYLNTNTYKHNKALKAMSKQIDEYNSYNRRYLNEGVYSFNHEVFLILYLFDYTLTEINRSEFACQVSKMR